MRKDDVPCIDKMKATVTFFSDQALDILWRLYKNQDIFKPVLEAKLYMLELQSCWRVKQARLAERQITIVTLRYSVRPVLHLSGK